MALRLAKWGVFLAVAAVLAWRMAALGLADHYAREGAADSALAWYPHHPQALFDEALRLSKNDPARARELLLESVEANPADGAAVIALARLLEEKGDLARAKEAVALASRLGPRQVAVQMEAAAFWLRQRQADGALRHWDAALRIDPGLGEKIYPMLLRFAENAQVRPVFAPLLAQPPAWWQGFFRYATATAARLDTLRALYQMRRQGGGRLDAAEQRDYLARLERDGQWLEAYFIWLNGLGPQQLAALGSVYNGGFEQPVSGQGFDWYAPEGAGALVETAQTAGAGGSKALHVVLQGSKAPSLSFFQRLLLDPGKYRLRGRARPESLVVEKGVQWTLRCLAPVQKPLAVSERFLGSDQWREFAAEFTVPGQDCQVQDLRLELAGRPSDLETSGGVWFDDLAIEKLD